MRALAAAGIPLALLPALALGLAIADGEDPQADAGAEELIAPPPANAGFDYQIGGDYPLPDGVTVVSRDWFASEAAEAPACSICYVNGFRTQANEAGVDRPDERAQATPAARAQRARRRPELGRRIPRRHSKPGQAAASGELGAADDRGL